MVSKGLLALIGGGAIATVTAAAVILNKEKIFGPSISMKVSPKTVRDQIDPIIAIIEVKAEPNTEYDLIFVIELKPDPNDLFFFQPPITIKTDNNGNFKDSYQFIFNHGNTETIEKGITAFITQVIQGGTVPIADTPTIFITILPKDEPGPGPGPGPTPGPLIENLSISTTSGLVPLTVGFSLELSRGFKTIEWNFGDGADLNKLVTSHTYRSAGVFDGFVRVVDLDNNSEIKNFTITVTEPVEPPRTCDPGFTLVNGICVKDQPDPQCDSGSHLENGICVIDKPPSQPVDIISNFFQSAGVIIQNQSVSFSIAIGIPSIEIEEIRWHFGDGSVDVFGIQAVNHTYTRKGTFGGHVIVTNINGKFEKRTFSVLVQADPIIEISVRIILSGFSGSLNVGEMFRAFADASGGVPPLQFQWDMGDGTKFFKQDITHVYDTAGFKQIQLTVTDSKGTKKIVGKPITVSFNPILFGDVSLTFKQPIDLEFDHFDGTNVFFRLKPTITVRNQRSDISINGRLLLRVFDFKGNQLSSFSEITNLVPNGEKTRSFVTKVICSCDTPFVMIAEYKPDGFSRAIAKEEIEVT